MKKMVEKINQIFGQKNKQQFEFKIQPKESTRCKVFASDIPSATATYIWLVATICCCSVDGTSKTKTKINIVHYKCQAIS